ncbi:20572_t:CDS:2 [Funneliformis geosporum]|uniref:15575_t:CDS:1 n=1 Tax=Funneliformis geosporum TaxID=1117311 RepID=A0A9W4SRK0_9GLOM|nr:15575_t:CDS:2 [Funneliformis geosporum]CAI2186044.1 20572_t:CDS:2 [Funneliformis geosporum]
MSFSLKYYFIKKRVLFPSNLFLNSINRILIKNNFNSLNLIHRSYKREIDSTTFSNISNNTDSTSNNTLVDKDYEKRRRKHLRSQRRVQEFFENNLKHDINFKALEDFPNWLKSFRLHKWSPCFEGMKWQEIIELNEKDLVKLGVSKNYVRFMLLKDFQKIKAAMSKKKASASDKC